MRVLILTLLVFGAMISVSTSEVLSQQADRPLKITSKPAPRLNGDCGSSGSDRMRVRVTFAMNAKITNVEVISASSCRIFDERAVKAAYKIKFEPAIKNGEAVTITRVIEYKYEVY